MAYEQGLAAIQKKQYRLAADTLRSVLELYPEEKELHERVRLYLRVCERQTDPVDSTARSPEEQVYAATLAVNAGSYDKAIELAADALRSNSDLDNAEYILAVALTLKGDLASAAVRLKQAIDLNHENRELARRDADLEPLRRLDEVKALLASGSSSSFRRDRRALSGRPKGQAR